MVVKVEPQSLVDMSAQALVDSLIDAWQNITDMTNLHSQHNSDMEFKTDIYTVHIPYFILNKIFNLLFKTCINYCCIKTVLQMNANIKKIKSLCNLLEHSLVPSLTVLDLSYLKVLGISLICTVKSNEIIRCMEHVLIKRIPFLNNLVHLNLRSIKVPHPVRGDIILEKVGLHCPKLKSLDVSHNNTVSNIGLKFLIPSKDHPGCSELNKIVIFKCSVTSDGVVLLLEGLPQLKHVGYEEIKCTLLKLSVKEEIKTKLNHLTLCHELQSCHIYTLLNICPKLMFLKLCVPDPYVFNLKELKELCELHIVYSSNNTISSPGMLTEMYFRHSGQQLISLSIVCKNFNTQLLKSICENCHNLEKLLIRCDSFLVINEDLPSKECLTHLKSFYFIVGINSFDRSCNIPYTVFHYVLQHTHFLQKLVIRMRNNQMNDKFMQTLLQSINVSSLKRLVIAIRNMNMMPSSIKLNMETVELIINGCPQLVELGNIFEWDLSLEEIFHLTRRLKSSNCALDVFFIRDVNLDNI